MKKVRSKLRPTEIGVIKTFSLSPDDEIGEIAVQCSGCTYYYNNLSELCEKWEDYEKPKEWWTLSGTGRLLTTEHMSSDTINDLERIGNKFETAAECELAAKKLRALKRLKEKGFKFDGWNWKTQCIDYNLDHTDLTEEQIEEADKDLDLLFSQEND